MVGSLVGTVFSVVGEVSGVVSVEAGVELGSSVVTGTVVVSCSSCQYIKGRAPAIDLMCFKQFGNSVGSQDFRDCSKHIVRLTADRWFLSAFNGVGIREKCTGHFIKTSVSMHLVRFHTPLHFFASVTAACS